MQTDTSIDTSVIHALSDWWEESGVSVDRRRLDQLIAAANKKLQDKSIPVSGVHTALRSGAIDQAKMLARSADTIDSLKAHVENFEGCELKQQAKSTVFADGVADADIMVIGEGPGRDEDAVGKPFVGPAGHLLDRMLASIGLSRETNTYITNVNFWRPPGNRNPSEEELNICRPFVNRHIALVKPRIIIAAGAVPVKSLIGTDDGIMKLRGRKLTLSLDELKEPVPVFPLFHPAYLLRRPAEKARAWSDLLQILRFMEQLGIAPQNRP